MRGEIFTILETPVYTLHAHYRVDDKGGEVEVWRVFSEEFQPLYNDDGIGAASIVSDWEKILRTKKTNNTTDLVEETIIRDVWRLKRSLREEFQNTI